MTEHSAESIMDKMLKEKAMAARNDKPGNLIQAIREVREEVSALEELVDMTKAKYEPVMRPSYPTPTNPNIHGMEDSPQQSSVTDDVQHLGRRLNTLRAVMADFLERCDL